MANRTDSVPTKPCLDDQSVPRIDDEKENLKDIDEYKSTLNTITLNNGFNKQLNIEETYIKQINDCEVHGYACLQNQREKSNDNVEDVKFCLGINEDATGSNAANNSIVKITENTQMNVDRCVSNNNNKWDGVSITLSIIVKGSNFTYFNQII